MDAVCPGRVIGPILRRGAQPYETNQTKPLDCWHPPATGTVQASLGSVVKLAHQLEAALTS
eukprot:1766082-Amphidinium_carterae.1